MSTDMKSLADHLVNFLLKSIDWNDGEGASVQEVAHSVEIDWLPEHDERVRAAERDEWISKLSALCDDDWLRRRDRCMKLPGTHSRHDRDAASAWEHAATMVRDLLPEDAQSDHESYRAWMGHGRDQGAAQRCEADGGHDRSGGYEFDGQQRYVCPDCGHAWSEPTTAPADGEARA